MSDVEKGMERVTVKQAARELNIDADTLRYQLMKGKLQIGYAIKREGKKRSVYIIYRGLLEQEKRRIREGNVC